MKTRLAAPGTRRRPRTSPAVHFLRPVFLAIAGLLAYGGYHANACAVTSALVLAVLSLPPALVLHSSHRGKREQGKKIVCG